MPKQAKTPRAAEPTHTPTPWAYTGTSQWATIYQESTNEHIAGIMGSNKKAHAALIVRAVNSHQELIDCLKDLAHYVHDQIDQTALQERVRLTITKAEGK